jgi:hypothetical protein
MFTRIQVHRLERKRPEKRPERVEKIDLQGLLRGAG